MTARGPSGAADAAGGLIVVDHVLRIPGSYAAGEDLVRRRLAARRVTSVSQQRMPAEEIVRCAG